VNEPAFVFPNRRRSRRARMKTRWRQLEVVFARWGGRALAVAVVLTTLSVAWAQIAHLAPAVAGDSRAAKGAIVAATLFFLGNIFFNYALCSARRAGVVEDAPRPAAFRESWPPRNLHNGKDAIADALANAPGFDPARGRDDGGAVGDGAFEIPRGAFAGCVPCAPCQAAKPPGAHHCSTCRQCVQAMDHHCPFVANCVGADTMRHFLLFVGYVALGNLHGVCLCFLAARERGGIGPAGGAVAAFLDALGSKQRFRHGWDDAARETTREGTGAVFGSKTLSRFLGPPPAFTAKALLRSGSPRGAVSLAVHGAYFAARGVSRVVAWRLTRRRTGSGGGRGSSAPAGPSASRPRFCSGPRSEASPRARPTSRASSGNKKDPETSSRRDSEPARTTPVSGTRRSRARLL